MELTLNSVNSNKKTHIKMLENRGTKGMWMHRILALKFAAWLNVKFEVWVYMTIDDLLFGQLPELAQKKIEAVEKVEEAERALFETAEYKNYELAKEHQKKINKAIKTHQENQLSLFL